MGRPLDLEDIRSLQLPSDPAVSPDGRQVVYVLRTTDVEEDVDRRSLWSVRSAGESWSDPVPLTRGTRDTCPTFSPLGDRIAFLRGSDGPAQLYVLPVDGGEAECVTDLPAGAGAPVWSPSGDRIAFTAPVRPETEDAEGEHAPITTSRLSYKADGAGLLGTAREHLHVLELASGEVRQLTDGNWHAGPPAWSPEGNRLAFSAGLDDDADVTLRSAPHVLDLVTGGPPQQIGDGLGVAGPLLWTADGAALLVTGQPTVSVDHTGLLRLPLGTDAHDDTAPVDLAGPLNRNVMPGGPGYPGGLAQLAADGTVVFCVRDLGCSHVYVTEVDGSAAAPRPVLNGDDVVVSGFSVASAAGIAAVVLADPTTYGEVAVVDLAGGDPVRLTAHTVTSLPEVELFIPEPRTFTVHDGTQVRGWLLRDPAAPTPAPLLVDAHGGPHNAWAPAADAAHPYHQALAAAGWAVLLVNPRGSDGYGRDFFTGAVGHWGAADERDFLDPVDQLVAAGTADPDRLVLTGYSYGGYMTCWLTGRTDRFAAAIAGGVVADLTSMSGTSDAGHALGGLEWPDPYTEPEQLAALSPLPRVHQVRTPTLLLQGQADERCPAGQAEQWFAALRTRGVPTELVLYPGSSHLFIINGRPSHRVDYSRRLINWTEQHVTPTSARPRIDQAHWQQRLDELAAKHQVPGASLAILRIGAADDELVEAATGVLSTATGVAATPDSVFQIGSITKVWTATLVMQLVDEGLLDLDAPLIEVLPDLRLGDPDVTKLVTMRHLLIHTSGIDGDIFTDTGRGDDCLEKYVAALATAPQNHPLGATFSYCNSGFTLAGRVVEVLTGKTWDAVLRERIIDPLGLTSTSTLPEDAIRFRAAVGHITPDPQQESQPVTTWLMPRSLGPAGLVNATARDVTAFAAMHLREGSAPDGTRVLSAESATAMQAEQTDLPDKHSLGDSWGLGWIRFGWGGDRLFGHDGATFGQGAFLRVLPGQGLSVALLTNGGHTHDLYEDLYREIFAEVAGVAMTPALQPPAQAPEVDHPVHYAGTYERSSVRIEVFERDGGLVLRQIPTGDLAEEAGSTTEEFDLVPVSEGLFVIRPPNLESWMAVTFYSLADGAEYVHYGARANPKQV